jgi:hypothetical protein
MQVDGTTDRVKVSIPTGIEINKEKLKFIISQNNTELIYVPPVNSRDIELTLMPPTSAGEYSILAVVKTSGWRRNMAACRPSRRALAHTQNLQRNPGATWLTGHTIDENRSTPIPEQHLEQIRHKLDGKC